MKNFKLLTALFIMLFVSTAAFGQISLPTEPPYTFVQDYSELPTTSNCEVIVVVQWIGSNGRTMEKSIITTAYQLSVGIIVYTDRFSQNSFEPFVYTYITVKYDCEEHFGKYIGFTTQAIRANDPDNWQVYF